MNAIDLKRVEFRHYLEACGVMDALSYALIKLYDEVDKPSDPVAFVRRHFKRPIDETDTTDIPRRIEDLDVSELIKKQDHELNLARQEIAKLQQMLNSMSSYSPLDENADAKARDKQDMYHEMFNDPKYDGILIKKYLTEELFRKLYKLQDNEPSIIDCIAKVNELQANPFGVYPLNGKCYSKFRALFEPIIKDIHCIDDEFHNHPDCDWGDVNAFEIFENERIESIEISCVRSLANMPFIKSGINEQDLEIILNTVQNAIQSNDDIDDKEIDGEFYKISDITENEPIFMELQTNGIGFRSMKPHEHTLWPTGRGLYINCARTQSILINEQEHLRFISKEKNGNFGSVYKNLTDLVDKFSNGLEFERNERFGWLTANIEALGTGICCKIRLKLKQTTDCIEEICKKLRIKITPIEVENECIVELTNGGRTFGVSEFECVKVFYDGIKEILQILSENQVHAETNEEHKTVIESNSQEPRENENEVNNEVSNADVKMENEQSVVENDATKNERNCDEPKAEGENIPIELSNTDEGNNEKSQSDENVANLPQTSDTNDDNINKMSVEAEQIEKDTIENDETQANQRETEAPEETDDTDKQSVEEAKVQTIEGEAEG
ncbi:arginine kinase-like [Contarinia nasturtii]|uniref:arginine kinase-like n=1 Tax=Contarinia nasturtii TaxID=265458 RepID=UPI0012D451D0|nr:arginine kinase-like [Contarinia nasturtii]